MKKFIRKPKFMRSDRAMKTYIDIASIISETMEKSELSLDEKYELLKDIGECINNAAKAGDFFRTEDFIEWMETNKH